MITWHVRETQIGADGKTTIAQDIPNYSFGERHNPPEQWHVLFDSDAVCVWLRTQDAWWSWHAKVPAIAIMVFTREGAK